jgi:hypothetical protein
MGKSKSSALELIQHVWDHNREGTGFSWERLNQSMYSSVKLAIGSGLKFGKSDFEYIAEKMRVGYWCGADGGEPWYSLAIKMGNSSAIAAFEQWKNRKPFLIQTDFEKPVRIRMQVGSRFWWTKDFEERFYVTLTSFSGDQDYITAVTYKERPEPQKCKWCNQQEHQYDSVKIKRRFKITHKDIKDYHAALKDLKKEREEKSMSAA